MFLKHVSAKFSNPYIFATQCSRTYIFQTIKPVKSSNQILKYQKLHHQVAVIFGIRKFWFVAKAQFIWLKPLSGRMEYTGEGVDHFASPWIIQYIYIYLTESYSIWKKDLLKIFDFFLLKYVLFNWKNIFLLSVFLQPEKCFCFALVSLLFFLSSVNNNL